MMLNKANKDEIIHVLTGLKSYTVQHFSNEETLFEEYSYPDMSKHKLEHKDFVGKVEDFFKGYNSGKLMLNMEVMNFLKDWLRTHINGSDRAYKDYLTGKGAR